ncbi:MAG: hypothetical protein DRP67_04875 [Candidatus Omnitrophota bacterium]|nr:MAG: hypothetical protein DRP67_04875 [Candidatus Omnitrophota bacterium]
MEILKRKFFENSPEIVARRLLGKIIIRKEKGRIISGKIVETECYFGENDPASRAYKKKNLNFYNRMKEKPGTLLIYMVHNNWLLNIISHRKGEVGAVLIRAVEPLEGIDIMKRKRKTEKIENLTSGPGKFTKSFGIDKSFDGMDITDEDSPIKIIDNEESFKIETSKRVGVREDLPYDCRFYIKGNRFVSKISSRRI